MTRIYRIWAAMKTRCQNPNSIGYRHYGGRGITVCSDWQQFPAFEQWALTNGYSDELTVERIDVDGNYCPENCCWATMQEQANNKTNNRLITFGGRTMTVRQWDRALGFRAGIVNDRLNTLGWSIERALTEPVGSTAKRYEYDGESYTLAELAAIRGISYSSLWKRIEVNGQPIEEALATPKHGERNMLAFNGETLSLAAWAERVGLSFDTLWKRIKCSNWSIERALTTPAQKYTRSHSA